METNQTNITLPQPTPNVQPQTFSASEQPKGSKWRLILIVLLILLIFSFGGYYLILPKMGINVLPTPTPTPTIIKLPTPTPDPTANWKTYTNNSLGIYFKYPQNYILKQTSAEQTIFSIESSDKSSFQLLIYKNSNNLSLKDYESKNTGKSGMGPNVYYPNAKLVKFENMEAYYEEKEISCFSKCGSYVWTNKDNIYKLMGSIQNKPDQKQILDQILSTLKFLSPSPTSVQGQTLDTSNWKTYTNTENGFSLKYPSDWNVKITNDHNTALFDVAFYATSDTGMSGGLFNGAHVEIYSYNQRLTLSDYVNQQIVKPFISYRKTSDPAYTESKIKVDTLMVNNLPAVMVSGIMGGTGMNGELAKVFVPSARGPYVFALKNDKLFVWHWQGNPDYVQYAQELQTFDQILSTFKFTQ